MIRCVRRYPQTDSGKVECVLISDTEPASGNLTGADVVNLDDNIILQAGSVLITPNTNYIAFADGVFTRKA